MDKWFLNKKKKFYPDSWTKTRDKTDFTGKEDQKQEECDYRLAQRKSAPCEVLQDKKFICNRSDSPEEIHTNI